jgi:small subunit ribosomal protein S9
MDLQNSVYATGKRKNAVARTWMAPGSGQITVNEKPLEAYFPVESARILLLEPFRITNTQGSYDLRISVRGGGVTGQAGAIRLGITRALMEVNPEFRVPLKKAGFVKRDPREKERKKYGQRGARARFQFSKR